MIEHKGDFVRNKLKGNNIRLLNLAKEMMLDQSTLFRWLNQKNLSIDKIMRISASSGIDFRSDFPELPKIGTSEFTEKNLDYKVKYYELIEKYAKLQEEVLKFRFGSEIK